MEDWKAIEGYEGLYEVSSLGRVRSLSRNVMLKNKREGVVRKLKGKIIKQHRDSRGSWFVNLNNYGLKRKSVHALVAAAFLGPTPEGMEICHGDLGRDCHFVSNLSFKTHKQNMNEDRERDGTMCRGETHPSAKLTENDVLYIRKKGIKHRKELSEQFKVSLSTIYDIVKKRSWAHV